MIRYKDILNKEIQLSNFDDSQSALSYLSLKMLGTNSKIFVLIDEYDNFANELITSNEELYYDIISSQGYIRTFYKNLKSILFYMGMLTIKESFLGNITLKVPNVAMREIYWEYFRRKYQI